MAEVPPHSICALCKKPGKCKCIGPTKNGKGKKKKNGKKDPPKKSGR